MNLSLSTQQVRMLRLKAQGLIPTAGGAVEPPNAVVKKVTGVQAQDLTAGLLSIRARSQGLTAALVEQDRQEAKIAWTWAMRGTLHLVAGEDARWLVPLLGPRFAKSDLGRMTDLGWDAESTASGLRLLREALTQNDGLTRSEIASLLEEHGLPFKGQATIHLIARAALEGLVIRGPQRGKETVFVLFEDWIGPLQPLSRSAGLEKLALRYLEAYAPAGPKDLVAWSGITLAEARAAWQQLSGQLALVGENLWMCQSQLPWLDDSPPDCPVVRLLPRFDTYLLGYANRDLGTGQAGLRRIFPGGGIIHPVLLVDGKALGAWRIQPGNKLIVQVELFEPLTDGLLPLIEAEVDDLGRFLMEESRLTILP